MSVANFKEVPLDIQMDERSFDETDKPPRSNHINYMDLGSLIFSFIFHFLDVGFDFYLAHAYYITGKYSHFAWTVAFIILPSIIITSISIRMYVEDSQSKTNNKHFIIRIILCVLGTVFQLALPIRYFDSFQFAIKCMKAEYKKSKKQQEKYFLKMLKEDSDVALLKVFECYLESAPQQVLQTTLLVIDFIEGCNPHRTKQIVTITLTFLSMGWCMANYHRCIRFDQEEKKNISAMGIVVQFFWHLNFTVSRILAITALASLNVFWTCIGTIIHWSVMSFWVGISNEHNFCGKNKILEFFLFGAAGLVYIFNFLNMKEGSTKNSYLFFFLLCFVENIIAVTIWGIKATALIKNWIYYVFIVLPILCFALSVGFIILYYQCLHPNKFKSSIKNENNTLFDDNNQINAYDQEVIHTVEPSS